jgi:hypothetical protein
MRIACDVKGTLEGPKKAQVVEILKILQGNGAKITVWSNLYSYASRALSENKDIHFEGAESKCSKSDLYFNENLYFDIAIEDDRMQSYLASKRFIWVDEIPDKVEDVEYWLECYFKDILKGNNELDAFKREFKNEWDKAIEESKDIPYKTPIFEDGE